MLVYFMRGLDDYHGSRGCPIHKQVKEVTHNMRMEEARQTSDEDVPMLAMVE